MGPIGCPETSVWNYHYTLRNSSEERSFHIRNTLFLIINAKRKKKVSPFHTEPNRNGKSCFDENKYAPSFTLTEKVNRSILDFKLSP